MAAPGRRLRFPRLCPRWRSKVWPLAPKEAHVQEGYEVRTSPFAPQAADIVIPEALRMLYGLCR